MSRAYAVDELQRAAAALNAGDFRTARLGSSEPGATTPSADPDQHITSLSSSDSVMVLGAGSSAATVAVAVAATSPAPARVIEAGPMHATALAAATAAELGVEHGWRRGTRDDGQILIERTATPSLWPATLPAPLETDRALTIINPGWDVTTLSEAGGWLPPILRNVPLVLVTAATAPGLRSLDTALYALAGRRDVHAVVIGPRRRKWSRATQLAATAAISELETNGRLICVDEPVELRTRGLTSDPLPQAVLSACHQLHDAVVDTPEGTTHVHHP